MTDTTVCITLLHEHMHKGIYTLLFGYHTLHYVQQLHRYCAKLQMYQCVTTITIIVNI